MILGRTIEAVVGARQAVSLAMVGLLLALAGCGGSSNGSSPAPAADFGRVRLMTGFYEACMGEHRNQPPKSEQAFREWLNAKQENLQKAGITIDQMFKSPRGEAPLQWVYGQKLPSVRQNSMSCYGYETQPVDGKRLVIGSRGRYVEMDETQFKSTFPKG